jgi:hypothetical protein
MVTYQVLLSSAILGTFATLAGAQAAATANGPGTYTINTLVTTTTSTSASFTVASPASPSGTVVKLGSTAALTDAVGNLWTLSSGGVIAVNGAPDTTTHLVSQIAYVGGLVWQNSTGFKGQNLWWSKASPTAAWLPTSGTATSPLPSSVTAPPPPPPPVTTGRPASNTGIGFYTVGNKIYDANGVQFISRGLNLNFSNGPATFEGGNPSATPPVLPGFMISGANSVRSLVYGNNSATSITSAAITAQLQQIVSAKQVPILCMYTTPQGVKTSGDSNPVTIQDAVAYWVSIAPTLKTFERYMLLNIANEWGPTGNPGSTNTVWQTTYIAAIKTLRAAGINCTLVVDAQGFGQDLGQSGRGFLETAAAAIVASDPQQNTVISLHLYGNATPTTYVATINAMATQPYPVIIGEFANASPPAGTNTGNPSPTQVTEQQILAACLAAGIGCNAWAWDNNNLTHAEANDAGFCMTTGLGGMGPGNYTGNPAELTNYGAAMVADWKVNAKPATIF